MGCLMNLFYFQNRKPEFFYESIEEGEISDSNGLDICCVDFVMLKNRAMEEKRRCLDGESFAHQRRRG